jgi:hypothetical protein
MSKTTQEQLDEIELAITAVLTGAQEYKIGWRSVRRADLPALTKERDRLEDKLAKENGQVVSVGYFDR